MTKADRELLLHLVLRMSMYIHPKEADSVINFIQGYEAGTKNKCDFTRRVRHLLADTYRINYSSDGWPRQIKRLAKRRHCTWLIMFRKLTLEIIANAEGGSLNENQREILKRWIIGGLLNRIEPTGNPWFCMDWVEEWQTLCVVKSNWFRQLWSRNEWTVIRAIDKLVQTNGLFSDEGLQRPSSALMQLKETYAKVSGETKAANEVG